jgi:uncharacterized protein YjiS (DUF1127 family)
MSPFHIAFSHEPFPLSLALEAVRFIIGAIQTVGVWLERVAQRRALRELDDRLLRDIGKTRQQAARESAKPFWKR